MSYEQADVPSACQMVRVWCGVWQEASAIRQ